jgi:hypothetical protein
MAQCPKCFHFHICRRENVNSHRKKLLCHDLYYVTANKLQVENSGDNVTNYLKSKFLLKSLTKSHMKLKSNGLCSLKGITGFTAVSVLLRYIHVHSWP